MDFVVEWLAHHFERARIKLRQFVEEQHAAMRQADFAGAWDPAPADKPGVNGCILIDQVWLSCGETLAHKL